MEIIDELEPERRGPYAGAVGYVGWGAATLDTAIAIRACVVRGDRVIVQAGAGIVADSDPARELAETDAKAKAVLHGARLSPGATTEVYSAPCSSWSPRRATSRFDLQLGRTLVVGRAVTSDVPIYDPTISRRHAEIALTANGVRVKDLGSSNGTFLNGARVTEAEAGANDVVTFGKVAFRVQDVTPPAPRPQVVAPPPISRASQAPRSCASSR